MNYYILFSLFLVLGCQSKSTTEPEENTGDTISIDHTKTVDKPDTVYNDPSEISPKVYSNAPVPECHGGEDGRKHIL